MNWLRNRLRKWLGIDEIPKALTADVKDGAVVFVAIPRCTSEAISRVSHQLNDQAKILGNVKFVVVSGDMQIGPILNPSPSNG